MSSLVEDLLRRRPTRDYTPTLSENAKAQFIESGFTEIARITTDEEVEWLRDAYDALWGGAADAFVVRDVSTRMDAQRGDRIGQIIRPETWLPQLKDTVFWRNGRTLAAQLLDLSPAKMEGWGHMVRKAPRDVDDVPWHQDEGYWDPSFDYKSLGVWMPLDPATVESGCMSMVPGSHKGPVREHKAVNGDPAVTVIVCEDVDPALAVPRPIPIGGASFHHCRTLHWSGPNRTDNPRRAVIAEWQAEPVKRETPHDRPWFWRRHEAMTTMGKPGFIREDA